VSQTHTKDRLPLRYGRFTVTLLPQVPLSLPTFAGSMFRGMFGMALQRVVCVTRTYDCPPCPLKERCVYPYVFESPPPRDTEIMRKYPATPHPFVLEPPPPGAVTIAAGDPLPVGVVLFGRALQYLPYVIFAFERLGQIGLGRGRVQCKIQSVDTSVDGASYLLYSPEERVLRGGDLFDTSIRLCLGFSEPEKNAKEERITLEFLTPVRLVHEERLVSRLEFHMVVRALLRRIAHVSYFHCGGDPSTVAFRHWIEQARAVRTVEHKLSWFDWERYSSRQQTTMTLGGLMGCVSFDGKIGPFLPLLRAGEVTHVGKGTSFGLGQYRIV
jgi:hypothetical protein